MKSMRKPVVLAAAFAGLALLSAGCGPKRKDVSDRDRKEAAHLASEAQFALSLKDYARTESLLAKAVELTPDAGALWISLGSARVRQGKKDVAKTAYLGALKAYDLEIAEKPEHAESWLKKVYVLALLGRTDEARGFLEQTAKKFPDTRGVRQFVDGKQFDRMLADPIFKANPKGCPKCGGSGYKGRVGIHELMVSNEELVDAINKEMEAAELKKIAMRGGMKTLHQDSLLKVKEGLSTLEEAIATVPPDL